MKYLQAESRFCLGRQAVSQGRELLSHRDIAANLPRIGTIDERFQSYTSRWSKFTGGRFGSPMIARLSRVGCKNRPTRICQPDWTIVVSIPATN